MPVYRVNAPGYKAIAYPDVPANTPGLSFPPDISLKPYRRARKSHAPSTGKSLVSMSEHLLHTSAHPKIDYLGKEEERGGSDSLLNHYLGVYDPESGQLQLVRARKLVLRGSVRPALASVQNTPKQENVSWIPSTIIGPSKCHAQPHQGPLRAQHPWPHFWNEKVPTCYRIHHQKCYLPLQNSGSAHIFSQPHRHLRSRLHGRQVILHAHPRGTPGVSRRL